MAKGFTCPQCGSSMWAKEETYHQAGTEVLYECNNNSCRYTLKKFEDN
jgi:predicted RNA-binding Zn-ribbon protein involved in translation (DUF1610 family)